MINFKTIFNLKFKNSLGGFTLIELIVAIAVLLLVVGTAVGIFISIVQHQRIILSEQELLNQASYVLERMSKALRVAGKEDLITAECLVDDLGHYEGHNYLLTRPVIGIYTGIKFINQSDKNQSGNPICQEFFLENGILKEIKGNISSNEIPLTSNRLTINSIRFGINGRDGLFGESPTDDNNIQPRVTIFLEIQTGTDSNQPIKKIQTTVSQRDLNVQ